MREGVCAGDGGGVSKMGTQSREELIARRDEIIEQLQGEWAIDKDWKSIRGKALRAGLMLFVGAIILLCVFFPIMYLIEKIKGTLNMQISIIEFAGIMAVVMFVIAAIGSGCAMIQSWFYRKTGPIVVEGSVLTWDRGKGRVPERLHLESLSQVAAIVSSGGYGGSVIFRMLGASATLYSKHMLVSEHDKNSPQIVPGVLSEGNCLIQLLFDIAAINTKLNELEEAL